MQKYKLYIHKAFLGKFQLFFNFLIPNSHPSLQHWQQLECGENFMKISPQLCGKDKVGIKDKSRQ